MTEDHTTSLSGTGTGPVADAAEVPRRERFIFSITDTDGAIHLIIVERVVLADYVCQWRAVEHSTAGVVTDIPDTHDGHPTDSPRTAAVRGALTCGIELAAVGNGTAVKCAPVPRPGEVYELRGTDERWVVVRLEYGSVHMVREGSERRRTMMPAWIAEQYVRVDGP